MKAAVAIFASLFLVACSEEKPRQLEAAPVTSVQQQSREIAERFNAEMATQAKAAEVEATKRSRNELVEAVQKPLDKWGELYAQLPGKQAKEINDLAAQMRAIRSEMEAIATNGCTFEARAKIFRGMDDIHAMLGEFNKLTPAGNDSFAVRMGTAEAIAREGARDLLGCRSD
jgi:HAMP domain-containing protein